MSEKIDVIIAGGGPAGLTTAKTASQKGANVLLLELQAQIGGSQTSAWIPPNHQEKIPPEAIQSKIEKINLHTTHTSQTIQGNFGTIIDKDTLNKKIASQAAKSGTDIWVSSPVKEPITEPKKVEGVVAEAGDWKEEIKSNIVIDATGSRAEWSSLYLKNILNSNWNEERNTQTNEYLMTDDSEENKVDLYFNSILAPLGHAWIYPAGRNFAMAGIRGVRIHPDSALDEFIGREEPERLENSVPIGAYRGQLPVEGALDETVSNGIIAVGSSAGQIYPFSGHGIQYAFEAGRIAGEVVAEAVQEDDYSEEKLKEYDRRWRERFGNEIKVGEILRDAFSTSPDRKMNSLLEIMEENPKIQNDFVNIFLANDLEVFLRDFFKHEECKKIVGEEKVDRILSLYP